MDWPHVAALAWVRLRRRELNVPVVVTPEIDVRRRAECVPAPAHARPAACLLSEVFLERSEACLKSCIIFTHRIANRYCAPRRGDMPPEKAPARAAAAAKAEGKAKAKRAEAKTTKKTKAKKAKPPRRSSA